MNTKLVITALIKLAKSPAGRRIIMYLISNMARDGKNNANGEARGEVRDMNVLSDEDMKDVKAIAGRGGPYSLDEVALLSMAAGKDGDGYGLNEDEDADESVIDGYARHLHNYLYTYKDEARRIDPSIDPSQDQIGIMAQDLEKVNPACVNTTASGVKTVDTGRLALMNAGAIADLARRLDAIEGGR